MKLLIIALISIAPLSFANAKDCTEEVLGAALQAEAMRPDAKDFSTPVGAELLSQTDGEQSWKATIVANEGGNVDYFVRADKYTCEILVEPIRSR
ncbi:hypothetical protein D3C87_1685750 [compost metagenome]